MIRTGTAIDAAHTARERVPSIDLLLRPALTRHLPEPVTDPRAGIDLDGNPATAGRAATVGRHVGVRGAILRRLDVGRHRMIDARDGVGWAVLHTSVSIGVRDIHVPAVGTSVCDVRYLL